MPLDVSAAQFVRAPGFEEHVTDAGAVVAFVPATSSDAGGVVCAVALKLATRRRTTHAMNVRVA